MGSLFFGSFILSIFGVDLNVVRVSGGLVIIFAAWHLLHDEPQSSNDNNASQNNTKELSDTITSKVLEQRAFYPLTFPFTVGPGAISIAITLGATLEAERSLHSWVIVSQSISVVLAVLVITLLIYVCYFSAERVMKLIGETGSLVFLRLNAFILLCIGIKILWEGLSALIHSL
jgi:multiple antibiotic resistance protein